MKKFRLSGWHGVSSSVSPVFFCKQAICVGLGGLVLSVIPAVSAVAAGNALFHPAPASIQADGMSLHANRLDRIKKEPTTGKAKLVVIDINALRGDSIDITLDSGEVLTYVRSRIETNNKGSFTWHGDLADKQGSAILVVNKGKVTGSVRNNGALYKIESAGNGVHAFIETDSRGLPPEHPPQLPYLASPSPDTK